jgi:hypothetical protein
MYIASLLLIVIFTGKFDGDMKPPEGAFRGSQVLLSWSAAVYHA